MYFLLFQIIRTLLWSSWSVHLFPTQAEVGRLLPNIISGGQLTSGHTSIYKELPVIWLAALLMAANPSLHQACPRWYHPDPPSGLGCFQRVYPTWSGDEISEYLLLQIIDRENCWCTETHEMSAPNRAASNPRIGFHTHLSSCPGFDLIHFWSLSSIVKNLLIDFIICDSISISHTCQVLI